MKRQNTTYETVLNAAAVDNISERIKVFLKSSKVAKRDILRYSITAEEILLKNLEKSDKETTVRLNLGTKYFRPAISLEIDGKANNVYIEKNKEQGVFANGILKNLGLSPEYNYNNEINSYTFHIKKQQNQFLTLIISLCMAFIIGLLGFLVPDSARKVLLEFLFTPLHDAFLNILGCIAGPMVFLSVAWGIYGIGDAATLKQVGKKILFGYIGTVYVSLIVITWAVLPIFSLNFGGGSGISNEMSSLLSMLLGIVPKNIFTPFAEGNTLQIIFLAVVIGIALLFLGQKTNSVARAVEQINYVIQFLIEFISRLVPYFIFIVIVKMIWSDDVALLLKVTKLVITFVCCAIILVIGVVCYSSLKSHIKPFSMVKKGLPTLLIAITTASSAAAFGTNMKACRNEYGIDDKIASFGIPLGMATFKPVTAVSYMAMSLFFAEMYKVNISVTWVVVMVITAGILALATPPIPGGALTAYTVLFTQLGIPSEALAIAFACDALFDFINTGCDQFLLPMVLLNQAGKLGMVDEKILKKRRN